MRLLPGVLLLAMKKLVQILTVAFAILVLAGYVMYSQQRQNRSIASGSKADISISRPRLIDGQVARGRSNAIVPPPATRPTTNQTPAEPAKPATAFFAPGSKSAAIFTLDPKDTAQQSTSPQRDVSAIQRVLRTNTVASTLTNQSR